ncbi:alpha-L-arabinofuranosidase 1 [Citrus sinensis]|nr:alpha-L-arabinofuranosidase 1-like [Citrus sinensis]XP_006481989.1 alpha-L-arabinofuranosidase 1-like [Citrus sinensis]XP_024955674.1 alpha-L-arabinofuranosidase 1-like [Citrus sinensis]KAH9675095.1 alpha-L-arabinofuranosidase 1 [Citrus sinensis]
MASCKVPSCGVLLLLFFIGTCFLFQCFAAEVEVNQTARLLVDASQGRPMPETLFGIFFEEINHAGAGGLWAELVSNRGFEAGGQNIPSNIDPWAIIGNDSSLIVSTDRSSCFERNKVALRMEVLCDSEGTNICPVGGVGVYNPGYWGMAIKQGKTYKVIFYIRSLGSVNISVSLTSSNGLQTLATSNIIASASDVSNWTRVETLLEAKETNPNARLQLTTSREGIIWFDQVSAMPLDTYKGHGFRNDLFQMLANLKPRFVRFPGGCFVEGEWLRNAFRWKASIGPWENRPGHFGDVWMYWTDDGLGYFEFLQLAEDLGALPIWVFNNGISHTDEVDTSAVLPFVQEALDGIEFARGDPNSTWGSVRAAMGHPDPFDLRYVAVGNEDCGKKNYRGNYLKFYDAIKRTYPDIGIISNCDGSSSPLDHKADFYDFHIYTSANDLFSKTHKFDHTSRTGPKAFVSEYAVHGNDAGNGNLLAALAEGGFLIGLEKNSDVVAMASYAPLFVNANDRWWTPDAIVFNSAQLYGTPSYWVQQFFRESSGATLLNATLLTNSSSSIVASAISWEDSENAKSFLRIKVVNLRSNSVNLKVSVDGLGPNSIKLSGSTKTQLTSSNLKDENSFTEPNKVVPSLTLLENAAKDMDVVISPYSFTSFDLLRESVAMKMEGADSFSRSSI